jgi:Reverse transcriptase (RNA-dependent DNA polymerase)
LRGFEQQENTDYGDTYTAIVRNETTRLLLSLCAINNWEIDQLNAISAFLNSKMDRIIYIQLLPGMQIDPNQVYLINLTLYGAKQLVKL